MPNPTRTFSCFRVNVSFALCVLSMGLGASLSEAQQKAGKREESDLPWSSFQAVAESENRFWMSVVAAAIDLEPRLH